MILTFSFLDGKALQFETEERSITIGRSNECNIILPFEGVSRTHLRLIIEKEEITVIDLKSTNGVSIGGERIQPFTPVHYQTYLNLSFGPVIGVQIDFNEESTENKFVATIEQQNNSDKKASKLIQRAHAPALKLKKTREKNSAAKELENNIVRFLISVLSILVVIYFYTLKK